MGPLYLWKGILTETFSTQPLTLLAYVRAKFTFVAVAIYMIDDFKRRARSSDRICSGQSHF